MNVVNLAGLVEFGHPVAWDMAQKKRQRKPKKRSTSDRKPESPLQSSEEVARAFLHLARLAASHAHWGTTFVDAHLDEYPADQRSIIVLARITRALLSDRRHEGKKAADALESRLYGIVAETFGELGKKSETDDDEVENRIAQRFRDLGFVLTRRQLKRFDVSRAVIDDKFNGSVADAAASALLDAINDTHEVTSSGRSVYDARKRTRQRPLVPGPLNRRVPLRDVQRYTARVFDHEAKRSSNRRELTLDALRGGDKHVDALIDRVEWLFKQKARQDLEGLSADYSGFAALMNDDDTVANELKTPEGKSRWAAMRKQFEPLRIKLREVLNPWHAMPSDEAAALEAAVRNEFARLLAGLFVSQFSDAKVLSGPNDG